MKEDWIECTLDKLIDDDGLFKDGDWVEKKDQDPNGQVRLIQLADIGDGNFRDKSAKFLNLKRAKEMNCSFLNQGDILIARMPEPLGRCTFFPFDEDEKFITAVDVAILRPKNEFIYNNFLLHQINSPTIRNKIDKLKSGTTRKRISRKNLNKIDFWFPSLVEQKAIVKKIEELFSSLDSGIADLKKAQDQLVIYRQAVLKKAFEGELTKEWREKQTNLPSADELLEQIETGRQSFYNNQIEEWETELKKWKEEGEIGKKPKKPRPLTIPDAPNNGHNERKWVIPNNWVWSQIGSLCFVTKLAGFEYTDYVNYDEDGDLPVLKAENAGTNGFKKTDFSKVKAESVKMLKRSQIFGGELLIVFVGAGTGNVAMVPFNQRYFLGPNIGMARPYFDLNSKYLELFLQSAFGKSLMMSAVKAVAQPSLSMGTIRQAPIAFPSLEEQHQIVQEIESRLSVCDNVEESIKESLQKAQALRQSILKKAFEGKLLSEDEIAKCKADKDYEPASVLLEKIKAEKKQK